MNNQKIKLSDAKHFVREYLHNIHGLSSNELNFDLKLNTTISYTTNEYERSLIRFVMLIKEKIKRKK